MIPCGNSSPTLCFLLVLTVTLLWGYQWPTVYAAATTASKVVPTASTKAVTPTPENDTAVVGSDVHLSKVAPPDEDLLPAGSKKFVDDFLNGDKFTKQGFKKTHNTKDADGYAKHDTFHTRDGDSFGYGQHFEFDKKGGDKHGGGYHESNTFDDDDAADSRPKFNQWQFDKKSGNPSSSYRYEGDSDDYSTGKLVGPDYEETKGAASRRSKRKKEPHPSATEYDNYEYADVEEPDDGAPADFEADEGDPEYAALYADADAYDYY